MSNIQGKRQMDARFRAIVTEVSRPTAERWERNAVKVARATLSGFDMPYSKGDLVNSVKAQPVQMRGGQVVRGRVTMEYHGYFVDAGTQGQGLQSRYNRYLLRRGISGQMATDMGLRTVFSKNRTNFSKKARNRRGGGYAARPFRERAAQEAMRDISMAQTMIDAWNSAA